MEKKRSKLFNKNSNVCISKRATAIDVIQFLLSVVPKMEEWNEKQWTRSNVVHGYDGLAQVVMVKAVKEDYMHAWIANPDVDIEETLKGHTDEPIRDDITRRKGVCLTWWREIISYYFSVNPHDFCSTLTFRGMLCVFVRATSLSFFSLSPFFDESV